MRIRVDGGKAAKMSVCHGKVGVCRYKGRNRGIVSVWGQVQEQVHAKEYMHTRGVTLETSVPPGSDQ